MAEGQLGGLEAELAADQGPGGVAELVRMPAVPILPGPQLFPLRIGQAGQERPLGLPPLVWEDAAGPQVLRRRERPVARPLDGDAVAVGWKRSSANIGASIPTSAPPD